jgi:hypothetical protein
VGRACSTNGFFDLLILIASSTPHLRSVACRTRPNEPCARSQKKGALAGSAGTAAERARSARSARRARCGGGTRAGRVRARARVQGASSHRDGFAFSARMYRVDR